MHEITLVTPFPAGEGGWGDRGRKGKLTAWSAGGKEGKPLHRRHQRRGGAALRQRAIRPLLQCRPGSAPGMQGAKPPAK